MYDVITLGTATRDVFLSSKLFRVVQDPEHLGKLGFPSGEAQCFALGSKIEVEDIVFTVGGGAANAAVTFARQGLKTEAIFRIGRDNAGRGVLDDLSREKVRLHSSLDARKKTAYSAILHSSTGERTILHYRGAAEDLTLKNLPPQIDARWLYVAPGGIASSVIYKAVKTAQKSGCRVAINPSAPYLKNKGKDLRPLLSSIDVLILNREEAAVLTGEDYEQPEKVFNALVKIASGIAVMTDGPRGARIWDGRTIWQVPIFKEKKIVDRTGAGDAFGSGLVASLARDKNLNLKNIPPEAIRSAAVLAAANATSVVEHIGAHAGILSKSDIKNNSRWRSLPIKKI